MSGRKHTLQRFALLSLGQRFALLSLVATSILACTKKKDSSASVSADFLNITGRVTNGPANPVSGAHVFLLGSADPVATSAGDGKFQVLLSDSRLSEIRAQQRPLVGDAGSFQLFIKWDLAGTTLVGLSASESFSARGDRTAGDINLDEPATLRGQVTELTSSGEFIGRPGLKVIVGTTAVDSGDDGHFELTHLPATATQLKISDGSSVLLNNDIALSPGEVSSVGFPLAVIPPGLLLGYLTPVNEDLTEEIIAERFDTGHPYSGSFKVFASSKAKKIRYHHRIEYFEDENLERLLTWEDVPDKINYDFPGNGQYNLYYQFSDGGTETTRILAINAVTDVFASSAGITIGDGSGITASRIVTVHVDLPPSAAEMRFAEDPLQFSSGNNGGGGPGGGGEGDGTIGKGSWQSAQAAAEYAFDVNRLTLSTEHRTLYCQFRTAGGSTSGVVSPVYKASVRFQFFPEETEDDIFSIAGGVSETSERLVDIDINVPPNAYELRIFEETIGGAVFVGGVLREPPSRQTILENWIRADSRLRFVFLSSGRKVLFLQFRNRDGVSSPTYRQHIFVRDKDERPRYGFQINGGSPTALLRNVTLSLSPPDGSLGFRFAESEAELSAKSYSFITDQVPYTLSGTGLVRVFMQFQDIDGQSSHIYQESILVEPFDQDPGDFIINDGSGVSLYPIVDLFITPPLAAVDMATFNGLPNCENGSSPFGLVWRPIDNFAEHLLEEPGAQFICLLFRNEEGDVSNVVQRSIIFDPFPIASGDVAINGGATITNIRNVELAITIPQRAAEMRVASNYDLLGLVPWEALNSLRPHFLEPKASLASDRFHTVWVQFRSEEGFVSSTYTDSIELELFPTSLMTVTINGGDAATSDTSLTLALTPPEAATGVRIAENAADVLTAPLLLPASTMTYSVSATPGSKTIYVQYLSAGGFTSAVFQDSIELLP